MIYRVIRNLIRSITILGLSIGLAACGQQQDSPPVEAEPAEPAAVTLRDAEIENIVERSYQYVAMYNVNNKLALDPSDPTTTGGWNKVKANTMLFDHTVKMIARPNNDTLYVGVALDLTQGPMIIDAPAFDSTYVSMKATGYDHYVNVLMSTSKGDFTEPSKVLLYTERTPGYNGEPVEGIDRIFEMTGDFISVVFRVMPHSNEPERMQRNVEGMKQVRLLTLAEHQTGEAANTYSDPDMPDFGRTDFDVFENSLLEVMQFVMNHTTFDPDNDMDQALLAAYAPLGIVPGGEYDAATVAQIDGRRFREIAERVAAAQVAKAADPGFLKASETTKFLPKGSIDLETQVFQSVIGPIGLPVSEAWYTAIVSADGAVLNANKGYVIQMSGDELPPTTAFWSVTLYDSANGHFMPNDNYKYSVGENAGFKLDDDGGIAIYLAAEQPEGVPDENWLPVAAGDYEMNVIMRVYAPDTERLATWTAPIAKRLE